MREHPDNDATEVVTAFLVIQHPSGKWEATGDFTRPLSIQRPAVPDDFVAGSATTIKDVTTLETAMRTTHHMQRLAQQMTSPENANPTEPALP